MNLTNNDDEDYILNTAKGLIETDRSCAKAWIFTGRILFPTNYSMQWEAYKLERMDKKAEAAAKCLTLLTASTKNETPELWNEILELTAALRVPPIGRTHEQEFYALLFDKLSPDTQLNLLMSVIERAEDLLERCQLLLLVVKRFAASAQEHAPRLLQLVADNIVDEPPTLQKFLVDEVLPVISNQTLALPEQLACRLYRIALQYFVNQIVEQSGSRDMSGVWKSLFRALNIVCKTQNWEKFLYFNKSLDQNVYWDKLAQIISVNPPGTTQVLFYTTTLFIYSLHGYLKNCGTSVDSKADSHVLVEGFTEWKVDVGLDAPTVEAPRFSFTTPTSQELSKSFLHAAQCWQLLNSDQFSTEFRELLRPLPLSPWISRFLFDLTIYFGHLDEANKLMANMTGQDTLVQSLQVLSLNLLQGSLTVQGFQCILKILAELPHTAGHYLEHLTLKVPRHVILIPLTQRALVQYCTRTIISVLSHKLYEPNCRDEILSNLLILLQLEYPSDTHMTEQIFALIATRKTFGYRLLSTYLVRHDFIEEFMYLRSSQNVEYKMEYGAAAPRTRSTDKDTTDEYWKLVKQQLSRPYDDMMSLIVNFITQEHAALAAAIFGNSTEAHILK